jgi:hypothetical protein
VLYDQPAGFSQHGGNAGSGWTDEESAARTGFQTFDNFSLATGVSQDRAFSLSDVPEPSSFLFVGAGIALGLKRLRLNWFNRK